MKHKTQKEMESLLDSYKSYSGTQKDFCIAHGIKANQLHYWRQKLSKKKRLTKSNKFISLKIESTELPTQIEISYPNGNILRLPANTTVSIVAQLLQLSY